MVPHKTKIFLSSEGTGRLSAHCKTCWILSSPIPQFKPFRGFRNFFQTYWSWLNPATIESPMSIVSKVFLLTWSSVYDESLANSSLKTLLRESLSWHNNEKHNFKRIYMKVKMLKVKILKRFWFIYLIQLNYKNWV